MMKLWLIIGLLSYLSYAISSSIDKHMMNRKYDILTTSTIKVFFDGLILVSIALIFFSLNIPIILIFHSLILGILFAMSIILYYHVLRTGDITAVYPSFQSLEILLLFISSIIIFGEGVNIWNFLGVILVLMGSYAVLSKNGIKLPSFGRASFLLLLLIFVDVSYFLYVKHMLQDVAPLSLAVVVYFSTTLILLIYQLFFKRYSFKALKDFKPKLPNILIAAFFGAMGTYLLFYALSIGNASKIYPIAGIQSVFVFIIASLFLKEKLRWHRLAGTILVFFGVYFIAL